MEFLKMLGINSTAGVIGFGLIVIGGFLILTGFDIISIEKVTVKSGKRTWIIGIIFAIIGLVFLFPEFMPSTPTINSQIATTTEIIQTDPQGTNTALSEDPSKSVGSTLSSPTATPPSNATQAITIGIEDPSCSDVIPELEVQMQLIFCESFDDNSNGWQVGEFSSSDISDIFSLQNGIYAWQIDCNNNNFGCVSPSYPNNVNRLTDFYLSADFRLLEGPTNLGYGFRFRNDGANYYEFLIHDNQKFSINSWNDGNFEFLIFDQDASIINPGDVNHLAIHAAGNRFIFYINNLLVADIENDYISEGIPGVVTYLLSSGQGILQIDNFSIYIP